MRDDIPRSPANQTYREYMEHEARQGEDEWDEFQRLMRRPRKPPITKGVEDGRVDDRGGDVPAGDAEGRA
jgi:hypothetical protein